MTEETFQKAAKLQDEINRWRKEAEALQEVIKNYPYYGLEFNTHNTKYSIATKMNSDLMVPIAKQCLEYAEAKMKEAQDALAEL